MCLAETAATVSRQMIGATCASQGDNSVIINGCRFAETIGGQAGRECRKHCGAAEAQLAVYAANTWLKHCHNTAQHFTTRCPMLLNPAQQHCSTPLKPSAQQRTCLLLHHLHPLVPLSSSSCKSRTLWGSTVASPVSKGPHSKRALDPQYPLSRAITAKHHCSSNRPTFSRTN